MSADSAPRNLTSVYRGMLSVPLQRAVRRPRVDCLVYVARIINSGNVLVSPHSDHMH